MKNKEENIIGRYITDKFLNSLIDSGKLDNLFLYLSNNKDKYNLTVRSNKFTLYSFGRGLDISTVGSKLKISFNMNNADLLFLNDRPSLDLIMAKLSDFGVDISKYTEWCEARYNYITKNKIEKRGMDKGPKFILNVNVLEEKIDSFDFKGMLDTIFPIFESYSKVRLEEKFRQQCMCYYSSFSQDIIVYDVEYKANFKDEKIKKYEKSLCQENSSKGKQFFKPDLVALKKKGNKYIPLFIELKVNISSSVGDKANVGDHIIDWQNYCSLYERSSYERENFAHSIRYSIELMLKKGLLISGEENFILNKIDLSKPPELLVVCGLINESKVTLVRSLKSLVYKKFKDVWKDWDTEIIIGENDPLILLKKGEKINDLIMNEEVLIDK